MLGSKGVGVGASSEQTGVRTLLRFDTEGISSGAYIEKAKTFGGRRGSKGVVGYMYILNTTLNMCADSSESLRTVQILMWFQKNKITTAIA